LLPFSTTFKTSLEEAKFEEKLANTTENHVNPGKFLTDVGKCDAIRRRREVIESEMAQLEKLMSYKKLALSISSGEMAVRTLHPAMQQTSKNSSSNFNKFP
jgi:hypothetical protein